jgi:malonate-semialdehyde dehydrogenase (acetylating)/methylmalonate-semialdehyde dehydrogenase
MTFLEGVVMTDSMVADRAPAGSRSSSRDVEVLRNYVGGRWVESSAREFLDVYNPARGEVIARSPLSTAEDLDAAVAAARSVFPEWRDTPAVVRARAMFRF